MPSFADEAVLLKDKARMTNRDLATAAGVTESTLSRYLSGRVQPPYEVGVKILQVLQDAAAADPAPDSKNDWGVELPSQMADVYERRIIDLKRTILQERREKHLIMVLLVTLLVFACLLVTADVLMGNMGWIRD